MIRSLHVNQLQLQLTGVVLQRSRLKAQDSTDELCSSSHLCRAELGHHGWAPHACARADRLANKHAMSLAHISTCLDLHLDKKTSSSVIATCDLRRTGARAI